jgi:hypothetical protein
MQIPNPVGENCLYLVSIKAAKCVLLILLINIASENGQRKINNQTVIRFPQFPQMAPRFSFQKVGIILAIMTLGNPTHLTVESHPASPI